MQLDKARSSSLVSSLLVIIGGCHGPRNGPVDGGGVPDGGSKGLVLIAGALGGSGFADDVGTAARFSSPQGVALDGSGNLYVADTKNQTIRKVTPSGVVTTLAGQVGQVGNSDGTGAAARFFAPQGVAVDGAGNLYVADNGNDTIRKVTPQGVVTTLAGQAGMSGSSEGTGDAARFNHPEGVASDGAGNLYIADTSNNTIRQVTPSGVVITFAGQAGTPGSSDGTGAEARFNHPYGVASDVAGNLYVADTYNHTIRKITPSGVVNTLAGLAGQQGPIDPANNAGDGSGAAARFSYPRGVALDGIGNLYVADTDNHTIRKVTSDGVVTTLVGRATKYGSSEGTGDAARFYYPQGVASDGVGHLYIADSSNAKIRHVTPDGVVTTFAGQAEQYGPVDSALDTGDGTGADARFHHPQGVASDGAGNLYIADAENHTIRKVTPSGRVTTVAGQAGQIGTSDGNGTDARFDTPRGVACDGAGNLYVADTRNHTIRKITPNGEVTTFAGLAGQAGPTTDTGDGTGANARFFSPSGLALNGEGNLYVADTGNHTIRKITPNGAVTTLAGKARQAGPMDLTETGDGTGADARFRFPQGLAADDASNLYVADTGNHTIRKVTPSGVVTTVAGRAGIYDSNDGSGTDARFYSPLEVALDGAGHLYVADTQNHTIRNIDLATGFVSTIVGVPGVARVTLGPIPAGLGYPQAVAVTPSSKVIILDENSVLGAIP